MSGGLFFIVSYFLMLLISCFMDSTLGLWVFMELSLYFLLVYMLHVGVSHKSLVVYYVTQTLGSCMILWGFLFFLPVSWIGLFIKLGLFPFSGWVFSFVSNVEFSFVVVLVFGFQKLLPLIFMVKFMWFSVPVVLMCLLSCMFGLFLMLQSISFEFLLAGSSIMHTSWVVVYCLMEPSLLCVYYCLYIFGLLLMMIFNLNYWGVVLFVFSSVPPLLGFILKWVVFCNTGVMWIAVLMFFIALSGLSVLGYTRWLLVYLLEKSVGVTV